MNEVEAKIAAYSIAFEGCISLLYSSKSGRRKGSLKTYPHYTPYISICGVNRDLLEKFCNLVGIGKVSTAQKSNSPKHRPSFRWELYRQQEVKEFLEHIIPFLPAKREQAQLLLEYCDIRLATPHPHSGGIYRYTYTNREADIWTLMKSLNRRGNVPSS